VRLPFKRDWSSTHTFFRTVYRIESELMINVTILTDGFLAQCMYILSDILCWSKFAIRYRREPILPRKRSPEVFKKTKITYTVLFYGFMIRGGSFFKNNFSQYKVKCIVHLRVTIAFCRSVKLSITFYFILFYSARFVASRQYGRAAHDLKMGTGPLFTPTDHMWF
jgi:hypothetical protein